MGKYGQKNYSPFLQHFLRAERKKLTRPCMGMDGWRNNRSESCQRFHDVVEEEIGKGRGGLGRRNRLDFVVQGEIRW